MPDDQLEEDALNRVVEWLGQQGEAAAILSRPDADRRGKAQSEGVPTPDARLIVDGREVVLDIVTLHQHDQSVRQHKALGKLTSSLETRLRAVARTLRLGFVVASASFAELPPRTELAMGEQQIFDRTATAMPLLREATTVDVEGLPTFVNCLSLSVTGPNANFVWVYNDQMHGGFVVGILQEALDRIIKKKRRQLVGATEGWVIVVDQTFMAADEDLAEAIPLITEAIPANWKRLILVRPWSHWAVSEFRIG
jgi:hypothetical protein